MSKIGIIFAFSTLIIILLSLSFTLLPSDILNYLPSYTLAGWHKPHNSLLADPIFQFEPWRIFARNYFINFQIPLWNPLNSGGVPFIANMQNAFFFPLNLIYYLFGPSTLLLIGFIKICIFFVFTYLFLRQLKLEKFGLLLGSIVASSSYMILWLQWPQSNVYLFFPILLFLSEAIKKSRRKYFICISLVYFLSLLGGHPETFFNIFIFHALYIVFRNRDFLFVTIIGCCCGLLLGSFILFPFIEYLLNSYALMVRTNGHNSTLSLATLPFFVFPQILGAPHLSVYKSIVSTSNYAEYTSGSIGLVASITILISAVKYRKNSIVKLSLLLILLSFVFSYLLGYINNLVHIPIFGTNNNQRFIIFGGFFSSITLAFAVGRYKGFNKYYSKYLKLLFVLFFSIFIFLFLIQSSNRTTDYYIYIGKYLSFVLATTSLFFIVLSSKSKYKKTLLLIILFLQVILPNITFNSLTKKSDYYPNSSFIKALKDEKNARILEVGNLNFPPNLNLAYGLESAENYDAMEIKNYKIAFDKAFPVRNHLGVIDEVNYKNLKEFGIGLVVSDYDLNSKKIHIQKETDNRILLNRKVSIPFSGVEGDFKGVRLITQSFNRKNNCLIEIRVFDKTQNQFVGGSDLDCRDVRDNMYYTVPFQKINLYKNKKYVIIIEPKKIANSNYIALKGAENGVPFIDILLNNKVSNFIPVFGKKSVNIFLVKGVDKIDSNIKFEILNQSDASISIKTSSNKDGFIDLKYTYYPGWKAEIDGRKVQIVGKDPFMKIIVPSGDHYIKVYYQPLSFAVGLIVSVFSFAILICYLLNYFVRGLKFRNWLGSYLLRSKKILESKNATRTYLQMVAFIFFGFAIGIGLIGLIPSTITLSYVTSINWLTVNNHSLALDYIKMGILFCSILLSVLLGWITLVSKK